MSFDVLAYRSTYHLKENKQDGWITSMSSGRMASWFSKLEYLPSLLKQRKQVSLALTGVAQ